MDEENNNGQQKPQESVGQKAQKTAQNVKDTVKKVKDIKKKAQHVKNLKNAAHASKFLTALGPALPYIGIALLVILIIIFLIGIIVFILTMPGMVMEKLKAFFEALGNAVAAFFGGDTTAMIDDEEVYEILDYLEDMGYDLKGYGFLTAYWDEDDVQKAEDADDSDQEGEPDNGVIRGKDDGKIIGASSEFILTYIMSDNYIYTVKNFNVINNASNSGGFWSKLWGGIVSLGQKIAGIFVNEGSLWGKGLLYFEDESGNEWNNGLNRVGWTVKWESIEVLPEEKKLRITRGAFANAFDYSLDGWTGRYGMSLEFLLSVHLATNMPDLAYDMVRFFGTVVTIRMDPADADVEAAVKNDAGELVKYEDLYAIKSEGWSPFDGWTLSKEEAKTIMEEYNFTSQKDGKYGCTGVNDATYVAWPSSVAGKCYTDAEDQVEKHEFISDKNGDLAEDVKENKYDDWTSFYQYIYDEGEDTDTGHIFRLPYGGAAAAFDLDGLLDMIEDLEAGWNQINSMVPDDQRRENPFTTRAGEYDYEVLKRFDNYPGMSIKALNNKDNDEPMYVDFGTWAVCEGDDQYDYHLEVILKPHGDNWSSAVIVYRDLTEAEIEAKGYTVEDSNLCSNNTKDKCCSNCRKYIKAIMNSASEVNEEDMATYNPYIRKVTDHWYRDVYFVYDGSLDAITIDEEYEALMKERWTIYETDDTTGQTIWYKVNADGSLGEKYDGTKDEAEQEGIPVSRKAITNAIKNLNVYEDDGKDVVEDWRQAYPDANNMIKEKIHIKTTIHGTLKQKEEGVRTETNDKIKRIFANNYYFKYDGNQETAEVIYKLRNEKDLGYGNLNGDDGTNGGSKTTLKNNLKKSITATIGDNTQSDTYYVSEYAAKVDLTKDALSAFSMLENTHTKDADYIYKDFKELIVELGYFEKEELAENVPEIFQWFIPEIGSGGYPIRAIDKKENMYGTMAHSKNDYEALQQFTILAQAEAMKAAEAEVGNGALPETGSTSGIGAVNSGNTDTVSGGLSNVGNTNVELVSGVTSAGAIERIPENGDGYHYKVKVGNVTYTHYYQFEGSYAGNKFVVSEDGDDTIKSEGCGPTSSCNILTGYGHNITPADTAGFLGRLGSNENLVKIFENWGVGAEWIPTNDDAKILQLMEECISEGKPFIMLTKAEEGGDDFWTTGGHFVGVVGVDSSGNMITVDSGSSSAGRHTYSEGLAGAAKYVTGLLIPDEAPDGSSQGEPYEGFEGGEAVVAPVTGILLEYGTYEGMDPSLPATDEEGKFVERGDRLNYDLKYPYSGITGAGIAGDTGSDSDTGNQDNTQNGNQDNEQQEITVGGVTSREVYDKVGYAKILVIDDENYLNLENAIGTSEFGGSLYNTDTHQYVKNYIKNEEMAEALSDNAKTLYSFKEFAELYDAFDLDGHIIYLDGFKTELPNQNRNSSESEEGEEETEPELGSGEMLSMQYFKDNASNYEHTFYEKDPAYNYTNEDVLNRVKAEDTIKSTSAPLYYDAKHDLVFIKEGTVIGRTYSDKEVVEELRGETYKEKPEDATSVEDFIPEIVGNYLRIVMRDRDDTVVENIEEYLKLDEEQTGGGDQPYNFTEQDLNELAILVHYEGCVEYFKNKGHSENEAFTATALTGYCTVNMALNNHNNYVSSSTEEGSDLHKVMMSGAYASSTKEHIKNGDPSCASCIEVVKHISEKDCDSVKKPGSDGTSHFNVGDGAPRNLVYQAGWCATTKWGSGSANCFWHIDTNRNGTYTWYPDEPYDEGFGVCITCCKDKK